jgi:hypothetical protein
MKGIVTIFVMPQEIDDLHITLLNLKRNVSLLPDDIELDLHLTLCVSDELTAWQSSSLPKEYVLEKFNALLSLCDWSKNPIIQIEDGTDILGCVSQRRFSLKNNPDSRRHIVSAWNPSEIEKMALPPCHCLFQFYVANNTLSCQLYQRSADVFLGVPFNIASYALLTHMMAHVLGYKVGTFVHTLGDAHLYSNHFEQAQLQLTRSFYPLPQIKFKRNVYDLFDFTYEDIELIDYQHHPKIKADVAV